MAYLFMLQVGGALALLLWAIHMVQTAVDRGWRPEIAAALRWASGAIRPAGIGLVFAIALQSATATGMLAAGFAAKGILNASTGVAIMAGADLGSALVVYFLSLKLQFFAPVLLIVGTGLFFKARTRKVRQTGRALAGIGLILVALSLLGEATEPLRESPFLPAIARYLGNDAITAVIAGAALTWLVHSSVTAIIVLLTLATHGLVPMEAAASLLIGANIGGALIPFGLTRGGAPVSRQIMTGNLILRGGGALIALPILVAGARGYLPGASDASKLVNLHLIFNATLLVVALPLVKPVSALTGRLVRGPATVETGELALGLPPSCLDPGMIGDPAMALGNTRRELIRMAEIVARMLEPIMDIYRTGDAEKIRQARAMEVAVNRAQNEIKFYLAKVGFTAVEQEQQGHDFTAIAVNLEYVGDAITKTLLRLAEVRSQRGVGFSPSGWRELSELHSSVIASMRLAQNVLVTRDVAQARALVQRKSEIRALVDDSMRRHMQRLKEGTEASVATSNIHLETVRALKTINSLLATIGYHVLAEAGDARDGRLRPAN